MTEFAYDNITRNQPKYNIPFIWRIHVSQGLTERTYHWQLTMLQDGHTFHQRPMYSDSKELSKLSLWPPPLSALSGHCLPSLHGRVCVLWRSVAFSSGFGTVTVL